MGDGAPNPNRYPNTNSITSTMCRVSDCMVAGSTESAINLLSTLIDKYAALSFELPKDEDAKLDSSIDYQTKCCPRRWKEWTSAIYILFANIAQVSTTIHP